MTTPPISFQSSITPPELEPGILPRPRLLRLLRQYETRRVILLHAPAGYGKTTLLASFHREIDAPVCWVRLSEADHDVSHLAGALGASLTNRFHRLRSKTRWPVPRGTTSQGLASTIATAVREEIGERFFLILDDVQWINRSEDAARFVDTLLASLPPSVTLILAGREIPEINLGELVIDAQVGGLGIDELALTRDETAELVEARFQRSLDPEALDRLYEETEGWITGVLLSPPSSRGSPGAAVSHGQADLHRVMASVVLSGQPEEVRAFLRESALLPRLTGAACDAILDREDSRAQLQDLVVQGLFISALKTEPTSYEYHPLLRAALQDRMKRKQPGRMHQILQRAAEHYRTTDELELAIDLYIEDGDLSRAATLAQEAAPRLFQQGRYSTLERWAKEFRMGPTETPDIYLDIAAAAFDRGELDKADQWAQAAQKTLEEAGRAELRSRVNVVQGRIAVYRGEHRRALELAERAEAELSNGISLRVQALILRLKGLAHYFMREDLTKARQYTEQAVAILEQTELDYTTSQALLDLSMIQLALGRLPESEHACQRAYDLLLEYGSPLPLAIAANNLAVLAHRRGHYERAVMLFQEALDRARRVSSPRHEAVTLLGFGDLFNDIGLAYQAGDFYGNALQIAKRFENNHFLTYGNLRTATLHRRSGNPAIAREWLQRARESDPDPSGSLSVLLEEAALELNSQGGDALTPIESLRDHLQDPGASAEERTFLLHLLALKSLTSGRRNEALGQFLRAQEHAVSHGCEQVLAAELHHDSRLLQLAQGSGTADTSLRSLRNRIEFMDLLAAQHQSEPALGEGGGLTLHALGSSRIQVEGETVAGLSPLPRQLLFFLVDNQPAERDLLLENFWPGVNMEKQTSSLYTAVHSLRERLGKDLVDIEGSLYRLNPDREIHFDVAEFERTAGIAESIPQGDARQSLALAQAITLYQGPFLPEFHSNWVLQRRRELTSRFLSLLLAHAAAAQAKDQTGEGLASLEQALVLEPLREDIHLRYLQLLSKAGRRIEAIRHYHALSQQLSDELGLEPSEELRDFYLTLLR